MLLVVGNEANVNVVVAATALKVALDVVASKNSNFPTPAPSICTEANIPDVELAANGFF